MPIKCTGSCGQIVTVFGTISKNALVPPVALCQLNKGVVYPCTGGKAGFGSEGLVRINFIDNITKSFDAPGTYEWIAPKDVTFVTVKTTDGGLDGNFYGDGKGGGTAGMSGTG